MENKLSKETLVNQQRCIEAVVGLINKGLPVTLSVKQDGDYKEVHIQCGSPESRKALSDVEMQIRGVENIWFDTATYLDGTREWSLDWSMELHEI